MVFEKEYPATHSMSTAWFGVDKDGKVALFDFNENGPVPQGLYEESDESIIEEILPHKDGYFRNLNLTKNQAEIIIETLEDISSLKTVETPLDIYIQVVIGKIEEFESIVLSHLKSKTEKERNTPLILNRELGLYIIDFYEWKLKDFKKLINQRFILKWKNFYIDHDEEWNDEKKKWEFKPEMFPLPFYLYQQPYSPYQLMERTYVPKFPFKDSQLSKESKLKSFYFDFSFNEKNLLQIAEYFPYSITGTIDDEGKTKNWLPITLDKEAAIEEYSFPTYYCGKTCNLCEFFKQYGYVEHAFSSQPTNQPKFLAIKLFGQKLNENLFSLIERDVVTIPFIYGYPFKSMNEAFDRDKEEEKYDINMLKRIFHNCYSHLEEAIEHFKPYAILLTEKTFETLKEFYMMSEGYISLNGIDYPLFIGKDMEEKIDILSKLRLLPYRGKEINRIGRIRSIKEDND